jgi:electron transport complex protein RnfG
MKLVIKMVVVLTLIGSLSGAMLSQLSSWAEPKIEAHRKAETEKAIFIVQPNGKKYDKMENDTIELYKVFDEKNNFIGYAFPYTGNGFQGKIRLMLGITGDLKHLTGIKILEQVETPGLGTKVTEDPFVDQFTGLNTQPYISWVKGIEPDKSNEVQAVTGATISSKSVINILNAGIKTVRELEASGDIL